MNQNINQNSNLTEKLLQGAWLRADECAALRRDFHRYPEMAWTEFRTTAKVAEYLESAGMDVLLGKEVIDPDAVMGYPEASQLMEHRLRAISQGASPAMIRRIEEQGGYTGAMVTIEGEKDGPCVAFRFDMDCIGVQEPQGEEEAHLPAKEGFASRNHGAMHACGHDGHTAMGMVLARLLYENRKELCGRVKVIFQPAEEGVRGGRAMAERGIVDDADLLFGIHIYPLPEDSASDSEGPALCGTQTGMYATRKWDVTLTGKAAHAGAAPEEGCNAILAAVSAISSMNSFLQDGRGVSRLNIGTIQGGTGRNVVAGTCSFSGESRGSETEVEERLFEKVKTSVKMAAELYGCSWEMETVGCSPAGSGDSDLAVKLADEAERLIPELAYTRPIQENTGTSDDFCFLLDRVRQHGGKGCYMALLSRVKEGLHSERYDFEENDLLTGLKACIAALHTAGSLGR